MFAVSQALQRKQNNRTQNRSRMTRRVKIMADFPLSVYTFDLRTFFVVENFHGK
jgi:hypothetical protein